MIKLTTNLSDPLLELWSHADAPIDGIEVGPWCRPQDIREYRRKLPRYPFYFHGGDIINRMLPFPDSAAAILRYVQASGSPWVSLHIAFFPVEARYILRKTGWRMPAPNPDRAAQAYIRKVLNLRRRVNVPVLLENPDPMPNLENHEVRADRIAAILEAAGCGLLLDIGHARLSAEILGLTPEAYLAGLPMDRVAQVHVSGPRMRGGRLFDAHEPLLEADYELLAFVLARSNPQVVTLEYIRRADALRDQLVRLRSILDSHP
jgi:uncharacterized protein (UPF0276 family)